MTPDQQQQNNLAHLLADKLFRATDKFRREHPAVNINGIIGAANIYLTTQYAFAPDRATALQSLEDDINIIRSMIQSLPDHYFGIAAKHNLN